MLRTSLLTPLRTGKWVSSKYNVPSVSFSSSNSRSYASPKAHLNLDPSYQALLKDIDISLKNSRLNPPLHRELEVIPGKAASFIQELSVEERSPLEMSLEPTNEDGCEDQHHRKSPAALFGSKQISMVILPLELQNAINLLISDEAKSTLRSDSARLFKAPTDTNIEGDWDTEYNTTYSSREKTIRHAVRDGMAFATVALPPHYSSIMSVLYHVKLRLEPTWEVNNIIDWGAGTGSGLWASTYSFQKEVVQDPENELEATIISSSIKSYLGIDKRDGLLSIGKRLVAHTPKGAFNIRWKKSFKEEDKVLREEGPRTIALSAFALTSLPTTMAQKNLVQEMWDSGAHTIVLIDHNTEKGFEAIAQAREYLLRLGREEIEEPETAQSDLHGSHVLAPCPHDHACPLLRSGGTSLTCGFSQRLQRPPFVRSTKRSGVGHEDIEYSYVVIRRGPRPNLVDTKVGRVGGIGKRILEENKLANVQIRELEIQVEETGEVIKSASQITTTEETRVGVEDIDMDSSQLNAQLRKEAYQWPRLVFRPLKKSGHIILDSCTQEGKIMRVTIPKSQGKQPFYDARKSSWGDIFPHEPKNRAIQREVPKSWVGHGGIGGDIGKRRDSFKRRERQSYGLIALDVREKKKQSKREYAHTRGEKVWEN